MDETLFQRLLTGKIAVSALFIAIGVLLMAAGAVSHLSAADLGAFGVPAWLPVLAFGLGASLFIIGFLLAYIGK